MYNKPCHVLELKQIKNQSSENELTVELIFFKHACQNEGSLPQDITGVKFVEPR